MDEEDKKLFHFVDCCRKSQTKLKKCSNCSDMYCQKCIIRCISCDSIFCIYCYDDLLNNGKCGIMIDVDSYLCEMCKNN